MVTYYEVVEKGIYIGLQCKRTTVFYYIELLYHMNISKKLPVFLYIRMQVMH